MSLREISRAIEQCKKEEERLQESICLCRRLLQPWRNVVQDDPKEVSAPVVKEDPDPVPEERQEMELVERMLERAWRVRSAALQKESGHLEKRSQLAPGDITGQRARQGHSGSEKELRDAKKSSSAGPRREGRGLAPSTQPSRVGRQVKGAASGKMKQPTGQQGAPSTSQQPAPREGQGAQLGRAAVSLEALGAHQGSREFPEKPKRQEGSSVRPGDKRAFTLKEDGQSLQLPAVWRQQRVKQCRLWKRVSTLSANPGPEKTQFMERLQSTFHPQVPSRSLADVQDEVSSLRGRCSDLAQCWRTEQRTDSTGPSRWEREYESLLMLEGLMETSSGLLQRTDQLREAVDAWERFLPGDHCPVKMWRLWGQKGAGALSPPVLSYSSAKELRELEGLRLRVDILQQQIHLQKVMGEELTPWLQSALSSGRPAPAVLRGLYSLLGEGGQPFPTLVLDDEPD
ncbi:tubulin epsilon and delta complex protein 2 isoform X2 [Lepisosteus oculatus]|uniref:tubulin epsilon and delta complex protein 2 isoform X2 n=1 Tax=Lepisosteus oculatus TaxID=7918 RepID=UPI0035F51278